MTRRLLVFAAALVVGLATSRSWAQTGEPSPVPTPDPSSVVGAPHGAPLAGKTLDERAEAVASLLRCPVCQGLSVKDSPATMAQMMKAQVRELLAAGYDKDQVLAYFERSYGEFVRLEPPLRGVNWLVWLGPGVGLLVGVGLVAFVLRRQAAAGGAAAPAADLPGPETLPADPSLARCVLRVRELAYGWPGGVPPTASAAARATTAANPAPGDVAPDTTRPDEEHA
jgi:cytochrome c-type biogenesis protein CcmH/NrfF